MSQATDLMGLGQSPALSERIADAGVGPITINVQGSVYSTGYLLKNAEYLVYISSTSPTGVISLPVIGSDNGALLADDYIICNGLATTVSIYPPSTVSIIGGGSAGSAGSPITLAGASVLTIWAGPTTSTWIYK